MPLKFPKTGQFRLDSDKPIRKFFRGMATHPLISFLIPFLTVLIGRALLLGHVPLPEPVVPDEFSYLLAGETFASFRATNPPHPLWIHFETCDILMHPTYMSKYPPMQGLILAFGQLVFGVPWVGVVLSMALFCGLLPWCFRAWLPPGWALFGAMLATYRIGILSYWTDTYWGGGAAAIGGAMVLGATRRLSLLSTPGRATVFILGTGILANSRPFEGLVLTLACGGYVLWKWFGNGRWRVTWPSYPRRFLPAACLVGLPVLLAMGFYDYRVTGNPLLFPYQEHERQYAVWTPFFWQQNPTPSPVYHHEYIRRVWQDWEAEVKRYPREHWPRAHLMDFIRIARFYFGITFFIGGFLFIPALIFGSKNRAILALLVLYYCGSRIIVDVAPHYTAPAAALIYLGVTAALRTSWHFKPFRFPLGKVSVILVLCLFIMENETFRSTNENRFLLYLPKFIERHELVWSFLDRQSGPQLVFVHYGPKANPVDLWTFNHADIDASRIVWADDMSPKENQKLLDYYPQRTAWLLDNDEEMTLRPYGKPTAEPLVRFNNLAPQ